MNTELKIEIRPIPNRNKISDFSEQLEYFSQPKVLGPLVDPDTRRYATGLTKKDVDYLKRKGFPYNLDDVHVNGVPHEFWESQLIKMELTNSPIFLFPYKSEIDYVKWKYLSQSNFMYKSEEEMMTGTKPQATHYIHNEEVALEIEAGRLERTNKLILAVSKMSLQRKRDIISILLDENTENKKENYLTVKFGEIFQNDDRASDLEALLKLDDATITIRSDIKAALQKSVLRRTKQGIFHFETNLGFSEEDVEKFLLESENQEIYLTIKSKLK